MAVATLLFGFILVGYFGRAQALPIGSIILAHNDFTGVVTNVSFDGNNTHQGGVIAGDTFTGSYVLGVDPNYDGCYVIDSYFSYQGINTNYSVYITAGRSNGMWSTLSVDQNNLAFSWNNAFRDGGLESTYFNEIISGDNGYFSCSIENYATENLSLLGQMNWMQDGGDVTIQFAVAPVPEPATLFLFSTGLLGIIGQKKRRWL